MGRAKSVLLGPSTFAEADAAPLARLREAGYQAIPNPHGRKLTKTELLGLLKDDVVGLIAGLEPLDREVLSKSKLKAVSRCGSGTSNVDLKAASELGIAVRWTPEAPVDSVAELTVGALLSLLRQLPRMDADVHAGRWSKRLGSELKGKTVAVVGFGRIGRRVAELLAPFGVKLLAVDPAIKNSPTLEEALRAADAVTLHCAGEERLLGERELGWMKPGAVLLNAARGGLIDEDALSDALENGRLAGAWLDVFSEEPYAGGLTRLQNILLTPHAGSYTRECRARMELESVENLLSALA